MREIQHCEHLYFTKSPFYMNTKYRIQCIEYNAYNKMHIIKCIDYKANKTFLTNEMHRIQCKE